MMRLYGCWTDYPKPHPWLAIADCACGYDDRRTDGRCHGCHRSREESPRRQLLELQGIGDAAEHQREDGHA